MRKLFEEPRIDVAVFPVEDVITASSGDPSTVYEEDEIAIVPFQN